MKPAYLRVDRDASGEYRWGAREVSVFVIRDLGRRSWQPGYASADHALRDAFTWWPELPALIYTRRP